MKIYRNAESTPVPGEDELIARLRRLHKRDDRPPISVLAVENMNGTMRLKIACHTYAEDSGARHLLEDRNFTDRLVMEHEETDEDGYIEFGYSVTDDPEFSAIYRPDAG